MIEVTSTAVKEQLEKDVDVELDTFQAFCAERLGFEGALTPSERAIVKTYLGYKLKVANEPTGTTTGVEASHGA